MTRTLNTENKHAEEVVLETASDLAPPLLSAVQADDERCLKVEAKSS